jgi:hypothetical protein
MTQPTIRDLMAEARAASALVKLLGIDESLTGFAILEAVRQRHDVDLLDLLGLDLLDLPSFQA